MFDYVCRWEKDNDYCKNVILDQSSDFYPGVLEYTDTAIYDFLMGQTAILICAEFVQLQWLRGYGNGLEDH